MIAVIPAQSTLQDWVLEDFQLDTAHGFIEQVAKRRLSVQLLWTCHPKIGCSHPRSKCHCSQLLTFLGSCISCEEQEGRQWCATYETEEERG